MNRPGEFFFERRINRALPRHPAKPIKMRRLDNDMKMGFSTLTPPTMTAMRLAVINHIEMTGRKCRS